MYSELFPYLKVTSGVQGLSRISRIFSLVLIVIQHVNKLKVSKTLSLESKKMTKASPVASRYSIKTLFLQLATLSKRREFPCFTVYFAKFCKAVFFVEHLQKPTSVKYKPTPVPESLF